MLDNFDQIRKWAYFYNRPEFYSPDQVCLKIFSHFMPVDVKTLKISGPNRPEKKKLEIFDVLLKIYEKFNRNQENFIKFKVKRMQL